MYDLLAVSKDFPQVLAVSEGVGALSQQRGTKSFEGRMPIMKTTRTGLRSFGLLLL